MVKNTPANAGDVGLIPGSGRSPGGGHGNPLQYSSWEIPWTEEPGGLQSQRVGHDLATEHTQAPKLWDHEGPQRYELLQGAREATQGQ